MKKTKDEMRSEYKRSDFATLKLGKFIAEAAKGTSVAVLEPATAKAFHTKAWLSTLPRQIRRMRRDG